MRVLVLGAGGPAGVNTCRALNRAGHIVLASDGNPDHLGWVSPFAQPVHMPEPSIERINALEADVVLAQPDSLVDWLATAIQPEIICELGPINAATFLPDWQTILDCQDKAVTVQAWHKAGLRDRGPVNIIDPIPDWLHQAADRFGKPFWLRATRGAGAKGAILVKELDQAYHWIRFWQTRGENFGWMAEEYLPGRDYAWSSIWYHGELVTSFARERLEYLYPHLTPEGLTGTPTIAQVVHDERVNRTARRAVLAVDSEPHGIYSVDLREDDQGSPRPTEINAGRGFTTFGLWSTWGPNFLHLAVKLAMGDTTWNGPVWNALPDGLRLERHIDCGSRFVNQYETVARAPRPLLLCA